MFFDQPDHWTEPMDVFNFFHGVNHQGKVVSKTSRGDSRLKMLPTFACCR